MSGSANGPSAKSRRARRGTAVGAVGAIALSFASGALLAAPAPTDSAAGGRATVTGSPGRDPALTRIQVPAFDGGDVGIVVDGRLDEAIWSQVPAHDNLTVIEPDLLTPASAPTHVHYFTTERGMYIGVRMEQDPATLVARLSSRDANVNRDGFSITLDPSGQGLYGYWFTVNLGGSVMDGTVVPEREYSFEWDGPWDSATAVLADGWSTEMFLPWSMMAMPDAEADGKREFGFWANRKVAKLNERWSSPALPFSAAQFMSNLGKLEVDNVESGQQFDVFPFVSFTHDEIRGQGKAQLGSDIFWRPLSGMQVTAALNPDFGSVESDDVVVNLTAFETFFPEKRLFFLEGQSVFTTSQRSTVRRSGGPSVSGARQTLSNFGGEPTTLVNTRRIGGAPRLQLPAGVSMRGEERTRPTDLLGAAKVTGQAGGFRYGVLAAFEDEVSRRGTRDGSSVIVEQDGRDFGIARLVYETGGVERNAVGYIGTLVRDPSHDAVVHGVDAHLLRRNGAFSADLQLLASDVGDASGGVPASNGYGGFLDLRYVPKRGQTHTLAFDYFDEDLDISDFGFIRRNDVIGARYNFDVTTSQGLKSLRMKRMSVFLSQEFNQDGRSIRSGIFVRNRWTFLDESEIRTELNFFPQRWDDRNSLGNGDYRIHKRWFGEVAYGTNTALPFSFSVVGRVLQEDRGDVTYQSLLGFTLKPNDRFSLDLDLDASRRDGWLLHRGGRNFTTFRARDLRPLLALDYFFSARQQLRLTLQWAGIKAQQQRNFVVPAGDGDLDEVPIGANAPSRNFTISRLAAQLRYRWEIAPLSDLFVVYTRGSNLPSAPGESFGGLFGDALREPIVDVLVVKLRYRFGR